MMCRRDFFAGWIVVLALAAPAATAGSEEKRLPDGATEIRDPLTQSSSGQWRTYEGKLHTDKATAQFSGQHLRLAGAAARKAEIGPVEDAEITTRVKLFVPQEAHGWQSGSIALYDRQEGRRAYIMVLFSQPNVGDTLADIGVHQSTMVRKRLKRGVWHNLSAVCNGGTARVKVWEDGTAEPNGWDVESEVTSLVADVDRVGLRTFGYDGLFRDFALSIRRLARRTANLSGPMVRACVAENGTIRHLEALREGRWNAVGFRRDQHRGPAWVVEEGDKARTVRLAPKGVNTYQGVEGDVAYTLAYSVADGPLSLTASIQNQGRTPFAPQRAGIRLGLDCAQVKYPEWREVFFPTLLRCERTHFWGYFMNPNGNILGICSPDPVASWHNNYKQLGHLIFTATIDLMDQGPLPGRHPQMVQVLHPGETRRWVLHMEPIASLADVKPSLCRLASAPLIDAERYTVEPGQPVRLTICSTAPCRLEAVAADGGTQAIGVISQRPGVYQADYSPGMRPGTVALRCSSEDGKVSEATVSVRRPWSWYLRQARREAIAKPQKGSSHAETWLGLYSAFLARLHFPDAAEDAQIQARFEEIFPLMYDRQTGRPLAEGPAGRFQSRIQNHALMAGLLAAKYRAGGEMHDLERAAALADFMVARQTPDGAYRNGATHYTSVAYCAKSIMEVLAEERKLAATSAAWKERYEGHYRSVQLAVEELARNLDNVQTEGEMTFEDGMISCSYTQLALFALKQTDPALRKRYLDAALFLKNGHRCLSQLLVPDSRMNGGSLRYWESQYDVLLRPNMMNSPHGWSAWRIYGLWYLYLLTGDEDLLCQVHNALGSCVQVIHPDTGELRWAFIADPCIRASVFEPDPQRPGKGVSQNRVLGETYMPMISHWYKAPANTWVTGYWGGDGGCCDNDVHEIFKCLEEVALTSAYVVERPDGTLAAWNCEVRKNQGTLKIIPAEACVCRIHLQFRRPRAVEARFSTGQDAIGTWDGMTWIGPGGVPELLRP